MNKVATLITTLAVLASMVFAAGDDLNPLDTTMSNNDIQYVEYCVNNVLPKDGTLDVIVDPICKDANGISGCQPADTDSPATFSAVPMDGQISLVDGAGCEKIKLTTGSDAEGLYYYTVNGEIGSSEITSETGSVLVPEFGVIGAGLALFGAGIVIARKRK